MNRSVLFVVLSIVLFLIALVIALGWVTANDPNTQTALIAGGLASFAAAHLP